MKAVTRTVLAIMLRKARDQRDQEKIDLLEVVLKDDELLNLVHEAVNSDYKYSTAGKTPVFGNPVQNFLSWLTEHKAEVFAAVKLILTLLAVL